MMRRQNARAEPIDIYLSSLGLYRKITAKDGSCLFRAVAEQVFYTQALHVEVREACVRFIEHNRERFEPFIEGPFDHHIYRLRNPKEWAGQVEISALSLMYKRDFVIYQEPEHPPTNVTQNGFENEKVILCFSHGNHYDSVYRKRFQEAAAVCQSVIYEILYKDVFKLAKEADEAVEVLRSSTKKPRRDSDRSQDGNRDNDPELDILDNVRAHRRPPLPYKVAKALDPEIYRNVEFDAWNEMKKEQQHKDYLLATGLQYAPGDKCQVVLEDTKRLYNAHIQEVQPEDGPVTVFIQDLGEKHTVPRKNLRPVAPVTPQRPWSPVIGRGYRNLTGYYQKYTNGVLPDAGMERDGSRFKPRPRRGSPRVPMNSGMILPQGFIPPHHTGSSYDQPCIHLPQVHNKGYGSKTGARNPSPPPRFQNRVPECVDQVQVGSRGPNSNNGRPGYYPQDRRVGPRGGGRYHPRSHGQFDYDPTMEEMDEKSVLEEMALFELQERDSSAFPALPSAHGSNMSGQNPAHFWSKLRKDNRRTPSPHHQRVNTPSPINHNDQSNQANDDFDHGEDHHNDHNDHVEDDQVDHCEDGHNDHGEGDHDDNNFSSINTHMQELSINESEGEDYNYGPMGADGGDPNGYTMNRAKTPEEYMGQVVNHMGGMCEMPPPDMQQAIPVVSGWVNSNSSPSSTTGSVQYQSASSTPSPPTIAMSVGCNSMGSTTAAQCPIGVPFYPVWIPVMDCLTGPINLAAQTSKDPNGTDLPLADVSTLRYFYNLGIEYHRRCCMMQQMQHWQQQQQMQLQPQPTDSGYASAGPCNASPPPMLAQQQVQQQQQNEDSTFVQSSQNPQYSRDPSGPSQSNTSVSEDEREEQSQSQATTGSDTSVNPQQTNSIPEESVQQSMSSSQPLASKPSTPPTPIAVTVSLASQVEQPQPRVLSSSNVTMVTIPQGPVTYQQPPQTPVHGIQATMGVDIERRDNRVANVPPLKSSMPRNIPSKLETPSERGVVSGVFHNNINSSSMHNSNPSPMHNSTNPSPMHNNSNPSPTILFCYPPDNMDINNPPRLSMETPPRRMSAFDITSPAGVFPMSPFPGTNNVFTSPSNTGPVHRQHQSYYVDGLTPSIGNMSQHVPAPSHPNAYYGPVPTNHNSNLQTDPYPQPMGQYQQAPPGVGVAPGPPPPQPASNMGYQYPMQQPNQSQWSYQYGSPVKAPGIPAQYGHSPPAATYVTNTTPAQYLPSAQ